MDRAAALRRSGSLLKVIWHDGQAACLFTKLREPGRFLWPSAISPAQPGYLVSGINWRHPQETWRPNRSADVFLAHRLMIDAFGSLPSDLAAAHTMIHAERASRP